MGYKLRSGQTIVDEDGNLNVIHGATLHIAGDLYANNQTGLDMPYEFLEENIDHGR